MDTNEALMLVSEEYDKLRQDGENRRNARVSEVYSAVPEIKEIDDKINDIGKEALNMILTNPNKEGIREEMKKKFEILKQRRTELLSKNNIEENFDKIKHRCPICKDTGYIEGKGRCTCFNQRMIDFTYKMSGMYELIKTQNFDTFDLELYSKKKPKDIDSPYDNMSKILAFCKKYAEEFDNVSNSLCFMGDTGLGKTFMACCVARELMDKGKSVIFLRATKLFKMIDDDRFGRDAEGIGDIYDCDLLIVDDLGTEAETKYITPSLLELINERLNNNKKIIITTNLSFDGMEKRYTKRFNSRLLKDFTKMVFYGEDIRAKKRI